MITYHRYWSILELKKYFRNRLAEQMRSADGEKTAVLRKGRAILKLNLAAAHAKH